MGTTARRRKRWIWLGLLPALLVLALLAIRWMLQPARLSDFLLRQASQATDLRFELAEPAGVGFWPDLHLELSGLRAGAPGAATPLLQVAQAEAVLPWAAVTSKAFSLRSLRLEQPVLDWPALQAWLATRSSSGSPPALPRVDAAIAITDGRIDADGWRLQGLDAALPSLRTGQPLSLSLQATLEAGTTRVPLDVRLAATPRDAADGVRFEELRLEIGGTDAGPLIFTGEAAWLRTGSSIALRGDLRAWPEAWPALPLPASDAPVAVAFSAGAGPLALAISQGEDRLEARLAPGDIAAWLDDPDAPLLPPVAGDARATRLQFGNLELEGVELRVEEATDGDR